MGSHPDIIWITMDMVRADHTSINDYSRETTPNLESIVSNSDVVNFPRCYSTHIKTFASVPSMLTGLYPSCHGLGMGSGSPGQVPSEMLTVPDLLGDEGYYTLGVSNGWAGPGIGIDERFDKFVQPNKENLYKNPQILLKYLTKLRTQGPGVSLDISDHSEHMAYFRTEIAKRELKEAFGNSKPVFSYIHYFDTHDPFYPPKSLENEFTDTPAEAYEAATKQYENYYEIMYDLWDEDSYQPNSEMNLISSMYDSIIKHMDRNISELFDFIKQESEDAIVVITSDHGVHLGEQGLIGHRYALHDAAIHVPLIVSGLPEIGGSSESIVQHIDIMQTILSTVNADVSQFQGYDLRRQDREYAISQLYNPDSYEELRDNHPKSKVWFDPQAKMTSVTGSEYKLVDWPDRDRFYKLPYENEDISESVPEIYSDYCDHLEKWMSTYGQPFSETPDETELSEETEQELQDLGYLN